MSSFTSKANGNWSAEGQTTWNEVGHPVAADDVTATHNITVDVDSACANLTSTGIIITQANQPDLTISGDWHCYGGYFGVSFPTLTVSGTWFVHDGCLLANAVTANIGTLVGDPGEELKFEMAAVVTVHEWLELRNVYLHSHSAGNATTLTLVKGGIAFGGEFKDLDCSGGKSLVVYGGTDSGGSTNVDFYPAYSQTDVTIYVYAINALTGQQKTGLGFGDVTAYYTRAGAAAVEITLKTQTVAGAYDAGGFVEVDSTNCKGLYRLDLPDAATVTGVASVTITVQAADTLVDPVTIDLGKLVDQDSLNYLAAGQDVLTNIYSRVGAPAGASMSADIAALVADELTHYTALSGKADLQATAVALTALAADLTTLMSDEGTHYADVAASLVSVAADLTSLATDEGTRYTALAAALVSAAADLTTLADDELTHYTALSGKADLQATAVALTALAADLTGLTADELAHYAAVYGRLGAPAAASLAADIANKTGYSLAEDGLDSVSTMAPSGVASNFREMMVQMWRRWFKGAQVSKTTANTGTLKTYADDGTTVLTTQVVTDDGTTENQGAAT